MSATLEHVVQMLSVSAHLLSYTGITCTPVRRWHSDNLFQQAWQANYSESDVRCAN